MDTEITCPRCRHTWVKEPTWRSYLQRKPGHKVNFLHSESGAEPKIAPVRLHYGLETDISVIEASLLMVQLDHKGDPFFRWIDCPTGTVKEIIERLRPETERLKR